MDVFLTMHRLIEAPTEPTVDAVPKAQIHGFTLANTVV